MGLGNVGQSLIELIADEERLLKSRKLELQITSISDSRGTAIDTNGLSPKQILKYKKLEWKGFPKYHKDLDAAEAIASLDGDVVVEVTPSTPNGEPGLSNIAAALTSKKHVVTANKGPLVVAYKNLMDMARQNGVRLLYEATVAAHLPVFCMTESCFKIDELQNLKGILNATTNFIIGEIERDKSFQEALKEAVRGGWTETDCSDDVDGIDAARKTVILANALFKADAKLEDVKVEGIRHVETMVKDAQRKNKKVKLLCEIRKDKNKLEMNVQPKQISLDDPLATVNLGNMAIKFRFKTSLEIFVSAQFLGPKQTAYAILNDVLRIRSESVC